MMKAVVLSVALIIPFSAAAAPADGDPPVATEEPLLAATTPAAGESEAATEEPRGPSVSVERGVLRNMVHKYRFPVPDGWSLLGSSTVNEISLEAGGCEECLLRVMVSPGNTLPLMETVRAILDQVESIPTARVVGQEPIRIAREEAYTVVKEETVAEAAPSTPPAEEAERKPDRKVRTRFVTFGHAGDKYYIVLRAPEERFASDDAEFERLLARFRFGSGLGGLFK